MEWISVNNRLPELTGYADCRKFLIWIGTGYAIAYWCNAEWLAGDPLAASIIYNPTHWMFLPEPPKESEKPAMKWISVDDRLPEKAIPCYVLINEKEVEAYFYPNIKRFVLLADEQNRCGTTVHITHWLPMPDWMPLPEVPNEVD